MAKLLHPSHYSLKELDHEWLQWNLMVKRQAELIEEQSEKASRVEYLRAKNRADELQREIGKRLEAENK